tara:strand:+ start:535 stop:687 length:153 start_codon:yes stop_codon:yes gene_type:complete
MQINRLLRPFEKMGGRIGIGSQITDVQKTFQNLFNTEVKEPSWTRRTLCG